MANVETILYEDIISNFNLDEESHIQKIYGQIQMDFIENIEEINKIGIKTIERNVIQKFNQSHPKYYLEEAEIESYPLSRGEQLKIYDHNVGKGYAVLTIFTLGIATIVGIIDYSIKYLNYKKKYIINYKFNIRKSMLE